MKFENPTNDSAVGHANVSVLTKVFALNEKNFIAQTLKIKNLVEGL